MSEKLKPCLFCGGEAELILWKQAGEWCKGVWCKECDARTSDYRTPKQAIEAWDRRVSDEGIKC